MKHYILKALMLVSVAVLGISCDQEVPVSEISITPEKSVISVGESTTLQISIQPEGAANTPYTLDINDAGKSIVSIEDNVVTGLAKGTATITVKAGNVSNSCTITVETIHVERTLINAANQTFAMGSPETDPYRYHDEALHNVSFTKDFYMSTYEITNAQYAAFLNQTEHRPGTKFTVGEGDAKIEYVFVKESDTCGVYFNYDLGKWVPTDNMADYPVSYVSWYGAQAFAEYVGGSLPSEAQWEFACKAGSNTMWYFGDDSTALVNYCVFELNSEGDNASAVGTKTPNAWGLYDMHGNVSEWTLDFYNPWADDELPDLLVDPVSPQPGPFVILRGGSWYSNIGSTRSAFRIYGFPDYCTGDVGFRVIFPVE